MSRSFWFGSFSILLLASLLFLFVSCFEQPVSPYQPVNTKLYLSVQSSTLQFTIGQYYVDTVGDSINIGVTSNLPQFVDSVTVGIFSDAYLVEQGTILKNINVSGKDPTWFRTLLNKDGKKYIIAKAFIQDGYKFFDTIIVNVLPRQAVTAPRSKPHISVTGQTTIAAGQLCSLSVIVNDSTVGQTHAFYAKQDSLPQASFTPPFMWTPPAGFSGTSTVTFKVADTDSPSYSDTQMVVITVLAVSPTNHAPKWANKTINEVGSPGNAINLTVSKMCTDPDGDLLTFSLVPGVLPSTDTIITSGDSSIYSFSPGPSDTGTFNPRVVATDPLGLSDTMTITLKINAVVVKSYSVTYDGNGSTGGIVPSDPSTYTSGSTVTIKTNSGLLVKTGSTFAGWNTAADGTGAAYAASATFTMGSANVTLYATWAANPTYTVTYNGNGNTSGTVPTDPGAYITGATVTTKTNSGTLVKTGSTFAGWNTAADGTGTSYAASATFTMSSANVTLYATWTANPTYTVTYNGNGNTSGTVPTDPGAYITGATVTTKTNSGTLVKTASTFAGWNTAADGTGTAYAASATFIMGSANVTLYATWTANPTYTVTYNGNGNTSGTVPSDPGAYVTGATVTTKTNSGTLAKTGSTFAGWNTAADGTGTAYAASATFTMGSANVTLYATWTANPTYTVTYNGNGNTSGTVPTDPGAYVTGATVTTKTNSGTLAKTGSTFAGWNTAADGTGTAYAASATFTMGSANVTLYATWTTNQYTVTFNSQGGSSVASENINFNAMATAPAAPTQTGYTFTGWYTDAAGTVPFVFTTPITAAITLYAKWTAISYTITYTLNGGTNSPSNPATFTIASAAITLANPTYTGYAFGGWYSNANFTGTAITSIPTGTSSNQTLYAQWTASQFTITYNLNGGTNSLSNPAGFSITSPTITLANPTYSGYTFGGWYSNANFTGTAISSIPTGTSSNQTLWAKWTATQYSITYNLNGGTNSSSNPASFTIASPTITLANPTYVGYTFGGWYSNANFTGTAITSIPAGTSSNQMFYAQWTATQYTIMYNLIGGTNNLSNPANFTITTPTITLANPTYNGYTFGGWFTNSGLTGTAVTSIPLGTSGNQTFWAKWTAIPTYTVSYSGGTGAPSDPNKYYANDSVTVLGAGSLINSGFTLQGWILNGVMYAIGAKFKIGTSNVTLTPSWVVMDREGNIYDTVTINGTIWMKQNLKTRSITLGNPMLIRNGSDWAANPSTPKCCFYGFNGSDNSGLGAFYNAAAVTSNNLAPNGWHVATINEYNNLMPTGNASSVAMTGTNFWLIPGTNETGFSAVGAGYCDSTGNFYDYQVKTYFGTSDGIDISQLYLYKMTVFMMNLMTMPTANCGFSVRCAKNP